MKAFFHEKKNEKRKDMRYESKLKDIINSKIIS